MKCNSVKEVLQKKIEFSKDDEYIVDDPEELKKAFRNLYNTFQYSIEIYNKPVLMLDEIEKMNCPTKEEFNAMNENLQKKFSI